ncbi:MAG: metallophosphoesterase [Eubacteriales bacterium]|nr:metallophosphoesterase [Eubacteriales bacterium]
MIKVVAAAVAALAVFFLIVMYIDNHRFVVRRYRVRSDRIRGAFRAVLIADLHEKDYGNNNEKLLRRLRELEPDLILVGGDLLVSGLFTNRVRRQLGIKHMYEGDGMTPLPVEDNEWMKNSIPFAEALTQIAPAYFVEGNHELRLRYDACSEYARAFDKALRSTGIHILDNEAVPVLIKGEDTGITLQGLNLPIDYYEKFKRIILERKVVEQLIGRPDPKRFTVLLTHSPVFFDTYAVWGADLSLCGHVHGGLMRLPLIGGVMGTGPNLFPRYSGGLYKAENRAEDGKDSEGTDRRTGEEISGESGEGTGGRISGGTEKGTGRKEPGKMIVTCGLGAHTLPIRIFNPGEITVLDFSPERI